MDDVIARIVDIERQCSADIEEARIASEKKIADHKRMIEEKKARERAGMISAENTRLTKSVEEAKKQIEDSSAAIRSDRDKLFHDPVLNERIKQDIISILLEG